MTTRLAVADAEIAAVWLGANQAGHGWRLVVTLKSGAHQVVIFDGEAEALEEYAALVRQRVYTAVVSS